MPNNIVLSDTKPEEAQKDFNHWLKDEPVTLLVILGNDEVAKSALKKANEKINDESGDFDSVRAVHAKNPEYIKDILKQLTLKPGHGPVNWNTISDYVLLSISNMYNNIGRVVTKVEFPVGPEGYINLAVLYAQAADENLNE